MFLDEDERIWLGQVEKVMAAVISRVKSASYWRVDTLSKVIHKECTKGTKFQVNDIKWTIIDLIKAGTLSASYDPATGEFGTLSYNDVTSASVELNKLKTRYAETVEKLSKVEAVAQAAEKQLKELMNKPNSFIKEVKLKDGAKVIKKTLGMFHEKFEDILDLCSIRENVFLYGPTGCGKSHVCSQVAESLKLPFHFVSCTGGMSEGVLGGRLLPVGKSGTFEYVISEFVKSYETGGVFLLDEIDACDPNVLLLINSALASNSFVVPNRPRKPYATKHADFICIAAANTVGTGADRLYSGRNKLDGATLDRFAIGKIRMDYDQRVETALCPDENLRKRLWAYREAINSHRLERWVSTRFFEKAHNAVTLLKRPYEWVDARLMEGWREDEIHKVKSYSSVSI